MKKIDITQFSVSSTLMFLLLLFVFGFGGNLLAQQSQATSKNPVIWADVPDPSVIRVGDTYYMSSTTMHVNPGVPIMKSNDLVNWEIVNYAYDKLGGTDRHTLSNGENEYGRGSWASSLRYREGIYYLATFSYTTQKTYVFQTRDIENGSWQTYELDGLYHDPSLFLDDGRAFLIYGIDDIRIRELTSDATALKQGGIDTVLIPNSKQIMNTEEFHVPAEGAHAYKINGKYYVMLITWPRGGMRTQIVYRADELLGEYSGKVILQDQGVAQGGFIDTPEGNWFGFLFKDHGAVGRIPMLVPMHWENGWPVMGVDGKVPEALSIEAEDKGISGIVNSDEFDSKNAPKSYNDETDILKGLPLVWQWNHVPDPTSWSLTARPGFLRLTNGKIDTAFTETQNTLTQRTFGPQCTGSVMMDVTQMKDGDYAGLGALQGTNGFVGVKMDEGQKYLIMVKGNPEEVDEIESLPISQNQVYLKISFDFKNLTDKAYFYYSLDGQNWHKIGDKLQMQYTLDHFMGYRFALFSYATEETGGIVDFDYLRIQAGLFKVENE
jgi:beta-xylosidase